MRRERKNPVSMRAGRYPASLRSLTVGGRTLKLVVSLDPAKPKMGPAEFENLLNQLWTKHNPSHRGNTGEWMDMQGFKSALRELRRKLGA